jgi:hypothetical protein
MTVTVAVDTGRPRGLPRMVQKLIDDGWLPRFLAPPQSQMAAAESVNPQRTRRSSPRR